MMYYPTFKPFSNTNILKTDIQEKDGKYLFNMEAQALRKKISKLNWMKAI